MKFLPLSSLDDLNSALNFETPELRVVGGCDIYTTKAAGTDKKLYRNIEHSLESEYESLLRLSASVSPPNDGGSSPLNLSRSSPFGPMSQISSRRTFAYLIATLNASHSDYDFSHILRPTDFRKERSLKGVVNTFDATMYNLRPTSGVTLQIPPQSEKGRASSGPPPSQTWCPHMWAVIDKEMVFKNCTVYCWSPPDEPFDCEEGSIWNLNYFFFNKELKRVAYIYVRGIPIITNSPRQSSRLAGVAIGFESGANKRARYWLGARADHLTPGGDREAAAWSSGDDECSDLDDVVVSTEEGALSIDARDQGTYSTEEDDSKESVYSVSEGIAASMDFDF